MIVRLTTCYRLVLFAACFAQVTGCHQVGVKSMDGPVPPAADMGHAQQHDPNTPAPAAVVLATSTVTSPDLPRRSISLAECIALALENGRTAAFFDGPGSSQKSSVTGLSDIRPPASATDSVRVFAYEPAISATGIEESLARFDVWAESSLFWNRIDQRNRFLTPLSSFDTIQNRNRLDDVDFSTGLFRRLPTGGFSGMRVRTDYQHNDLGASGNGVVNPAYRPMVDVLFEQPLWQGAGVLINQLRDFHPASIRQVFPDGGKPPGIMLVRISQRQQQLEFERQVHELVYRVEEAYWQLYAAYWDLYSSENGLKQAHASWLVAKSRYDAGGLGIEDLSMIEEQYHFFRNQRLQALGRGQPGRPGALEAERRLRYVVGLPAEDGNRLIPHDAPDFVAYEPDAQKALAEAQANRPELKQVEEEIRAAELILIKSKDRLKPDLRFVSRYGINGLGDGLDDSINDLLGKPHHEWELGLRLQYPIGFRAGHADTTRARLQLTQRMIFLKDQREKLLFSLQRSHQELVQYREQYKVRVRQRETAALQLRARFEKFKAGGDPKQPGSFIDLLLRAQRNWADAVREEYLALCNYRIAITDFERQKGTILRYANVSIVEGAVPLCAHGDASQYLSQWCQQARPNVQQVPQNQAVPVEVADGFPLPEHSAPARAKLELPIAQPSSEMPRLLQASAAQSNAPDSLPVSGAPRLLPISAPRQDTPQPAPTFETPRAISVPIDQTAPIATPRCSLGSPCLAPAQRPYLRPAAIENRWPR